MQTGPTVEKQQQEAQDDDSKFDEFMGNDAGALAVNYGEYDQDDKEADEVIMPACLFCQHRLEACLTLTPAIAAPAGVG